MPQGVGVRVSSWVLKHKTPDKVIFIRGFWFDKVSLNKKNLNFQSFFGSGLGAGANDGILISSLVFSEIIPIIHL